MRFGTVHRVLTTAIVALGIFAVLSAGVLSSMAAVISVLGLLVGILLPESIQNKPWVAKIFPVGLLLLFFLLPVRIALGGPPLELAIEGITYAQVLRIATRRGAAQDPLLFAFALVHFVSGTVFGGGLGYAACFVGFLVLAPGALVLSHLRREVEGNYRQGARDRTGLPVDVPRILRSRRVVGKGFLFATCALALPMLVVTAGIFLIFPRVGLSLFFISQPRGARMVGFSDHV